MLLLVLRTLHCQSGRVRPCYNIIICKYVEIHGNIYTVHVYITISDYRHINSDWSCCCTESNNSWCDSGCAGSCHLHL